MDEFLVMERSGARLTRTRNVRVSLPGQAW